MSEETDRAMAEIYLDWKAANQVIVLALRQWFAGLSAEQAQKYAVAIQARLAKKKLLIQRMEE